ncbi:MAG: Zn-dependent hydrolase [Halodesulfurarchaeum sp.]
MEIAIDADRLWADLEANAEFGAIESDAGRGRTVLTGTPENTAARDRLCERLQDAGCTVTVDRVGNIVGRWTPPSADAEAPAVAAGSHLDSVPSGGIFDGPLGVYSSLEAVRSLQEAGVTIDRPIDVVCFTEEEGARFGPGLLGSAVATGVIDPDVALEMTDDEGRRLGAALEAQGYLGETRVDAEQWAAWVEVHVEQSRRLERAGEPVGVVTDITGIAHLQASIEGTADHAGATPMDERTDALAAASEVVLAIEAAAQEASTDTAVGTVGSVQVQPNATNVVPGRVELGVDIRDIDRTAMDGMLAALEAALQDVGDGRAVETTLSVDVDLDPTPMTPRIRETAQEVATAAGLAPPALHSGAAHDTMHVAKLTDAGLLFARSEDGRSHSPLEWTTPGDCGAATEVLTGTLARLAGARLADTV